MKRPFTLVATISILLLVLTSSCGSICERCNEVCEDGSPSFCIGAEGLSCGANSSEADAISDAIQKWEFKSGFKYNASICQVGPVCQKNADCFICSLDAKPCKSNASNCYNSSSVKGLVSGDFDKNRLDDVSSTYFYSSVNNTTAHLFKSDGSKFNYQGDNGWWASTGSYNGNRIRGVVAGDFNNDGLSDQAIVYYYGSNDTRIHVLKSTGTKFNYQGNSGWWSSLGGYDGDKICGVVAGDFNNDNLDDIAIFYDYGNFKTTIHVFKSDGSKFNYQGDNGWLELNSYDAAKIKGRIVAGDFDGDNFVDIATLYDYDNFKTTIHVFKSDGNKFNSQGTNGWLALNSYDAKNVTGRVVSGDFNGDGFFDIATFYDYGNSKTTIHVFKSDGNEFNSQGTNGWLTLNSYDATKITGRVVSGDFDGDQLMDLAALYDYGGNNSRIHVFKSGSTKFDSQGSAGWWNCK